MISRLEVECIELMNISCRYQIITPFQFNIDNTSLQYIQFHVKIHFQVILNCTHLTGERMRETTRN